jgi:hypothetical protein
LAHVISDQAGTLRWTTSGTSGPEHKRYQDLTSDSSRNIKATTWQNHGPKSPFFSTIFSRPFKNQSGAWRNGTSFGLHDLAALMTVAHEAKQWIAAHALKR